MSRQRSSSRGHALAERLQLAIQEVRNAPVAGAREIAVLTGLSPNMVCGSPIENVLADAERILLGSGKVFTYGDAVVLELGQGEQAHLVSLAVGHQTEAAAASLLANLFVCEQPRDDEAPKQFPPPKPLVSLLLNREPTRAALPHIQHHATRPVFDRDFVLRQPGWHADVGILVHGNAVAAEIPPDPDLRRSVRDRLPRHLWRLLGDFCLRDDADLVNGIAVLLTGLLVPQFVESGKPVVLLDGNQPGLGKTLFARVVGFVLDGVDCPPLHFTPADEELQKRICATLRGGQQSVLIIDNAKVRAGSTVSSPVIESNSMSPEITLRILGQSENFRRPNDLVWMLTMNDTKASADLVSRGLPVRFAYEGNPSSRQFDGRDPLQYAREHRHEILGELVGMVLRWNQLGRPEAQVGHRCDRWARIIGGILEVNGLPDFLGNLDEAAGDFDTELDELAALAEAAVASGNSDFFIECANTEERDHAEAA
jgi:hypothetical protein